MEHRYRLRLSALLILLILSAAASAFAENWSFAVFADNRNFEIAYRNVLENMKFGGPSDPAFKKPDFAVGVGDIDPVKKTFEIFRQVMGPEAPFIPVRGNHESPKDVSFILKEILSSEQLPVTAYEKGSVTFYYDWKNVRLIAIDQYTPYAANLDGRKFLKWLQEAIVSAEKADHIFIAFHEPRFTADVQSDPFWSMLIEHSDKIRAVLWAHTHFFSRRSFPDSHGKIALINVGAAGNTSHSDGMNTFIQIAINGKKASFRAVQAADKTKDFTVVDSWQAVAPDK